MFRSLQDRTVLGKVRGGHGRRATGVSRLHWRPGSAHLRRAPHWGNLRNRFERSPLRRPGGHEIVFVQIVTCESELTAADLLYLFCTRTAAFCRFCRLSQSSSRNHSRIRRSWQTDSPPPPNSLFVKYLIGRPSGVPPPRRARAGHVNVGLCVRRQHVRAGCLSPASERARREAGAAGQRGALRHRRVAVGARRPRPQAGRQGYGGRLKPALSKTATELSDILPAIIYRSPAVSRSWRGIRCAVISRSH